MERLVQWGVSTMRLDDYDISSRGGWVCLECNRDGAFRDWRQSIRAKCQHED